MRATTESQHLPSPRTLSDTFPEYVRLVGEAGIFDLRPVGKAASDGEEVIKIGPTDAIVVVDMQNDFMPVSSINPLGGNFMVPGGHQASEVIVRLMRHFDNAGALVVATRDYHPHDHVSFSGQGGTNPPHCIQGHVGSFFYDPIKRELDRMFSNATKREKSKREGRLPVVVFKGFHEDVDSFSALRYTDSNFKERRERKNVIGKLYVRKCDDGSRSVTVSKNVVEPCEHNTSADPKQHAHHKCTLRGAWTGSFALKSSSLEAALSSNFFHVGKDSEFDSNAPPDALAALHSRRRLSGVFRDEGITRIFVVGVAGDICVLDTCLNSPVKAFLVLDASRPVYLPGIGVHGTGFTSSPTVIVRKLRRENVSVVLTKDILGGRDEREVSKMSDPSLSKTKSATETIAFDVKNVDLMDLVIRVDVKTQTAKMELSRHPYLSILTRLGFGESARTSAASSAATGTTSRCFVYPLPGVEAVLLDSMSPHRTTLATLALINSALQFLIFGGFVDVDARGNVLRAITTTMSNATTDRAVDGGNMILGTPRPWRFEKDVRFDSTRLHPTTIESIRRDGCVKFCWLAPGEAVGAAWKAPEKGAFLYFYADGSAVVREVTSFIEA
eukprot:g1973.t1